MNDLEKQFDIFLDTQEADELFEQFDDNEDFYSIYFTSIKKAYYAGFKAALNDKLNSLIFNPQK